MTMPSNFAQDKLQNVRAKWGWFVALGIVFVLLGFFALGHVLISSIATALYVGAFILVAGAAQVIHAFRVQGWSSFLFWLLCGVLYIIAGGLILYQPLMGATIITIFIGAALAVEGVFRIFAAFASRGGSGWGWVFLSGLITLALGCMIIARWPVDSVYVLGIFLGVDLVFAGVSTFFFGLSLRENQR
ncbi:HdeD family acid-resistance protein [Xanthobacter sp. TB0136]|uniref:HdeD family acid-resistance protein n=1 Tax=Xanthobacter sp. TB0136 TaxID=3459177 RepID=UPI004039D601